MYLYRKQFDERMRKWIADIIGIDSKFGLERYQNSPVPETNNYFTLLMRSQKGIGLPYELNRTISENNTQLDITRQLNQITYSLQFFGSNAINNAESFYLRSQTSFFINKLNAFGAELWSLNDPREMTFLNPKNNWEQRCLVEFQVMTLTQTVIQSNNFGSIEPKIVIQKEG